MDEISIKKEITGYMKNLGVRPDVEGYKYLRDLVYEMYKYPYNQMNVNMMNVAKQHHRQKSMVRSDIQSALTFVTIEKVKDVCKFDFTTASSVKLSPELIASCIVECLSYSQATDNCKDSLNSETIPLTFE